MNVAVVNIGEMGMRVGDPRMLMRMGMRLLAVPLEFVLVLVMLVVPMAMVVRERLVRVLVFVPFADMQPDPERHQCSSDPEQPRRQFRPDQQRQRDAE